MPSSLTEVGSSYPAYVGFIYVFNLVVGVGALTMPKAFAHTGWLLATIMLVLLAIISYITTTFIVESMAIANALDKTGQFQSNSDQEGETDKSINTERTPVLQTRKYLEIEINEIKREYISNVFEIKERVELGKMAGMFYNKVGNNFFYLCICIYLYGDLAIYAVAVAKSLTKVACNDLNGTGLNTSLPCWGNFTVGGAYRIFVAAFTICLGPFVFFNVQKTKYLQVTTSILRWLAFAMMLSITFIFLGSGKARGHPPVANFAGIPTFFGICIYSFMCQHSLPSMITPIREKKHVMYILLGDYVTVLAFYALLSHTAIFTFPIHSLEDLYTLNFTHYHVKFISFFLSLFPVFTLSSNFPIIGVTLRNNLKSLLLKEDKIYPFWIDRIVFPLLALIPPVTLALITKNLEFLAGITGSYAGVGVQYVIPSTLVYYGRKEARDKLGNEVNIYSSPFKHWLWIPVINIWAIACVVFVTINHIITKK
ncbi:uncharacterized protein TRIADDRAFT_21298 [Trichoplax adhaerens]|uniref:Amino acid transporter transmembrane domain-containing protein n=1 Tax=Trichoplax adhaerens TaxID=10228 RepID=B3RMK5_TRIAD|nr:hypothetical protein TRIADDRAFT_21298 [Trichoplax adhaerens]EDV28377.1 hypothetical protein TRIADDRAFT_21298 [Trichoplax adhaerens]|eukprot:XP_002110211.1 hypothetical protein TRIADDRAFT_21298 [Trichoplax adhaerens]